MGFIDIGARSSAQLQPQLWIFNELASCRHQFTSIVLVNEETSPTVLHDFWDAADVCGEHWQTAGHSLQQDVRSSFMFGSQNEKGRLLVNGSHIRFGAEELKDIRAKIEFHGLPFQRTTEVLALAV